MITPPAPLSSATQSLETEIHISDYLNILYKRKTFIFLFFVFFILVVSYRTFQTVPLYQSTVELVIEPKSLNSPITGKRMEYETNASQILDMGTHFRLIKAKAVIRSVVTSLKLDRVPEKKTAPGLFQVLKQKLTTGIKKLIPKNKTAFPDRMLDPETQKMNRLVRRFRAKMNVKQIKRTRVVTVSVTNPNPKTAADIANSVAQEYIKFDLSNRVTSSKQNLEWLNSELYELKKELEDNERAFFEYKTRNKVFSLEGKQKVAGQKIAEFNSRYLEARNQRLDLDSKINELKHHMKSPEGLVNVRSLINNSLIEDVYNKIGDLEIEYTKLSKFYKAKHPKIIQVKNEIERNQRRLDFELEKELTNLKSERSVVAARGEVLEKTIMEFEQDALASSSNELTYSILQRNVETSQKLYDILLSRIKESDILKDNSASNIRIVEQAAISRRPISPKIFRNLLLAIIFGLLGGSLLAFFFEYMDQTLRTPEDVQSYLNLPVLSAIPEADRE